MSFAIGQFTWQNLRLRNQVLIILVAESIIVFIIMFTIQYLLLQMIQHIFMTSMKHIMIKEMQNKLNTQMWANFRSASYMIDRNAFQVLGMSDLFNYSRNLLEIQQPADFLLNFENLDEYAFDFSYTYSYFGESPILNDPRDIALKKFTSLATQVLLMQDEFAVYYATIRDDSFFGANQGMTLVGFKPQIRPWYVNQMQNLQNIINQSPPYITWGLSEYVFTQTTNLTYFDSTLEGVVAGEYNQSQFQRQQIDSSIQTMILGQDGLIQMTSDGYLIGKLIYDQNVTGYSYIDFVNILQSLGQSNSNQCTYNIDLLCLFNQSRQTENIITAKRLKRSGIIIMLQLDPSDEFESINEMVQGIVQTILMLSIENILVHFAARLLTTVLSVTLFFIISKPIHELVTYTKSFIHDQQSLLSRIKLYKSFQQKRKFDPISDIKQAYLSLINNLTSNQKCLICLEMELLPEFQYANIEDIVFHNRLFQIRNRIHQIHDCVDTEHLDY